jgi:DNA-binding NtrC family response regulator
MAESMKILVADANQLIRDRVISVLEHQDHTITARAGGLRTMRTLQERRFDLIMVAEDLPELKARDILLDLPEMNQGVPVVVMQSGIRRAEWPEWVHILTKPFTTASLLATLNQVIGEVEDPAAGTISRRLPARSGIGSWRRFDERSRLSAGL